MGQRLTCCHACPGAGDVDVGAEQNDEVLIAAEPLEFVRSDHSESSSEASAVGTGYRVPDARQRPLSPNASPAAQVASESSGSVARRWQPAIHLPCPSPPVPCGTQVYTFSTSQPLTTAKQRLAMSPARAAMSAQPPRTPVLRLPSVQCGLPLSDPEQQGTALASNATCCSVYTLSGQLLCTFCADKDWRVLALKDLIAEKVQTPQGVWDITLNDRVLEDPSEQPLLSQGSQVNLTIVQLSPSDQCGKALRVAHRAGHADPKVRHWAKEELIRLHAGGFDPVVKRSQPTADIDDDFRAAPAAYRKVLRSADSD